MRNPISRANRMANAMAKAQGAGELEGEEGRVAREKEALTDVCILGIGVALGEEGEEVGEGGEG